MKTGTLYLIPTNLSDPFTPSQILPANVISTAVRLNHYVAENAKSARAFLKRIGFDRPLVDVSIRELNSQTPEVALKELISPLIEGHDVGLVSDAGAPGVADPGALLVALAHSRFIHVVPLVGPSSILLGLMASGLNGQTFSFHGYLPQDKSARISSITALERESQQRSMTQLFIETPYRNQVMCDDLLKTLAPTTLLCIARDLTGSDESIQTKSVNAWQKQAPEMTRLPTLFLFLAKAVPRKGQKNT
jgi:16S rRNA (cytidine1402-2'-O)-methyltransferase